MRTFSKVAGIILIITLFFSISFESAYGATWEFGAKGKGQNPFTPRGYLVDTGKGIHWLSSPFNNSGASLSYSGVQNGVDYLEAKKSDGSSYTFYAMTDRNPSPGSGKVGAGRIYLFAYKNGQRISGFTGYVNPVPTRNLEVDPSGSGNCWSFKIEGFELEAGCQYEFGFLRGMQANNGITLVLAENEKGYISGYIQETAEGLSRQEQQRYREQKNREYEFISSWSKRADGKGFDVNRVPMRFSLRTYADLGKWEKAAERAEQFLGSVSERDFRQGKYKRENIRQLKELLVQLGKEAEQEVKRELQPEADRQMESMIRQLNDMLQKAKSDKPQPADISKLQALLTEAKALYEKASENVGIEVGQYGRIEVENLGEEIEAAEKMDKFTPQDEINRQVKTLQYAMTEVKVSLVQEEQMVFYDKITGIYVIAPSGALPEQAKLFVRRMGRETLDYKAAEKNLSKQETAAVFYRIGFYQGDKRIQPDKRVEVQVPIDDSISRKSSAVYQVREDGKLQKLDSVRANGTQTFRQKILSAFVVAGSAATEAEKAEARGERMKALMAQKKDKRADNKENQLKKSQKQKEEYQNPLSYMMKESQNPASFSNDIRKETDPVYVLYLAAVLAVCAIIMGIRGLKESKIKAALRSRKEH